MKSNVYFKKENIYKTSPFYLQFFLKKFWFSPSDVLQRSLEANIWNKCYFKNPILEIGIGNGKLTNFLFKDNVQIDIGVDIDKRGLASASKLEMSNGKNRYRKVTYANAEEMPFVNGFFATVISNSTFEHIKNDLKAISEVSRVLKKRGLFFVTVPSLNLKKWILKHERKKNWNTAGQKLDKFNEKEQHFHYHSFPEWKEIFKKNNLELIFYKFYFKKEVALHWYSLFSFFTLKLWKREVWSWLGDSKLTSFIPKKPIINLLESYVLKDAYKNGFFTNGEEGAQLFMIAKKV